MQNKTRTEEENRIYIILKSQEIVNYILGDLKKKICLKRYDKLNLRVRELLKE